MPIYLRTRGAQLGGLSPGKQWQNYAAANLSSIPSPILAGFMCKSRWFWGRRGTMIIGAMMTMVFFFAYTQVRSNAEQLGFTCAVSFCLVSHTPTPFPLLQVAQTPQSKTNLASLKSKLHLSGLPTIRVLINTWHVWVASLSQRRWKYPRRSNTSASGIFGTAVKTALSGWRAYSHVTVCPSNGSISNKSTQTTSRIKSSYH